MRHQIWERVRDDRGAVPLEFVILVPLVLITVVAVMFAGRLTGTESVVTDASQAGARAASLARTPDDATNAGIEAAERTLPLGGVQCVSAAIDVDTSEWFDPGFVTVTVVCEVEAGDMALIGGGPITSIRRTWSEAVDPARRSLEVDLG